MEDLSLREALAKHDPQQLAEMDKALQTEDSAMVSMDAFMRDCAKGYGVTFADKENPVAMARKLADAIVAGNKP